MIPLIRPPVNWRWKTSAQACFLKGWEATSEKPNFLDGCAQLPIIERTASLQRRPPHAFELERALGLSDGFPDVIPKHTKSVTQHQGVRKSLLLRATSVYLLTFLLSAILGAAVDLPSQRPCDDAFCLSAEERESWAEAYALTN